MEIREEEKGKKRGRKRKDEKRVYKVNREKSKFFVDMGSNKNQLELVFNLLSKANNKGYGKDINFKELALYSLSKLTDKDIEKIQESSLGEMEKVQRALDDYNLKSKESLSLGEYLVKKLNIN
jgi:hypothetical protein